MGYVSIISAILAENTGKILDKYNFKHTKINPREMLYFVFAVMAVSVASFIAITRPELPALSASLILSLSVVVVLSFISNVFDENSLEVNHLTRREPISNFRPILAGSIGYLLFPDERDVMLLVALLLSALVVAWGTEPSKLARVQKAGITYMILAVIAEAWLTNAYVFALEHTSPEYIALVRTVFVWVMLATFYRPKKRNFKAKKQAIRIALLSGIVYGIGAVVSLYAIDQLGVVTTMLLLLFAPALRYASAFVFLKDLPTKRQLASSFLLALIASYVAFL